MIGDKVAGVFILVNLEGLEGEVNLGRGAGTILFKVRTGSGSAGEEEVEGNVDGGAIREGEGRSAIGAKGVKPGEFTSIASPVTFIGMVFGR